MWASAALLATLASLTKVFPGCRTRKGASSASRGHNGQVMVIDNWWASEVMIVPLLVQ